MSFDEIARIVAQARAAWTTPKPLPRRVPGATLARVGTLQQAARILLRGPRPPGDQIAAEASAWLETIR